MSELALVVVVAVLSALAAAAAAPSAWRVAPRSAAPAARASGARRRWTAAVIVTQMLAAALVAAQVGCRPALAGSLVAVFSGIWLAAVDLRTHRLPIYPVYVATASVLVLLVLAAFAGQDPQRALAVCAGVAALRLTYRAVSAGIGGMGVGDVRLSPLVGAVGAWAGWHTDGSSP